MQQLEFILLSCVALPYILYYIGGIIAIGQESKAEREAKQKRKKTKLKGVKPFALCPQAPKSFLDRHVSITCPSSSLGVSPNTPACLVGALMG